MAESWTLKVERAEHHFRELRRGLSAHAKESQYRLVPSEPVEICDQHDGRCWDYQLNMTPEPDPRIAVIAGDVLFNLRSALDHIAVAMVPSKLRHTASFPIEVKPIWERKHRRFVIRDPSARRRYRSATQGMPSGALEFIERVQPYHGRDEGPEQEALYLLSRLNNADKHRQLVAYAGGLLNMISEINWPGGFKREVFRNEKPGVPFARDGQHVLHFSSDRGTVRPSDVLIQLSGTPVLGIRIEAPYGPDKRVGWVGLEEFLGLSIAQIGKGIIPALEPYVRRHA